MRVYWIGVVIFLIFAISIVTINSTEVLAAEGDSKITKFKVSAKSVYYGETISFTGKLVDGLGYALSGKTITIWEDDNGEVVNIASATTSPRGEFKVSTIAEYWDGQGNSVEIFAYFPGSGIYKSTRTSIVEINIDKPYSTTTGSSVTISPTKTQSTNSNWNIGEARWLEASYPVESAAHVRIIEPDMNFSPNKKDSFQVQIWSDTDAAGILITVTEVGNDKDIFEGLVLFTDTSFSSGNTLRVTPGDTITVEYTDSTLPSPFDVGDGLDITGTSIIRGSQTYVPSTIVELDQKAYTWTDRVFIKIISPIHNKDPNSKDTIGDSVGENVIISTRLGKLTNYKLVETGANTGVFVGEVILTGYSSHDANGDGKINDATGKTGGAGPNNGMLESDDDDGVSVAVQHGDNDYAIGSALVRWNIAESMFVANDGWLGDARYVEQTVRVIDPDMNLDPNAVDTIFVDLWSDTDPRSIKLFLYEAHSAHSGIFEGVFQLVSGPPSINQLRASTGDTVTVEYEDHTLPDPYTPNDVLDRTGTTYVSFNPPYEIDPILSSPSTTIIEQQSELETKQFELESQEIAKKQQELETEIQQLEIKKQEKEIEKLQAELQELETPSEQSGGGCLIATATFGSELAPQVQQLREIRDNTVLETASGSAFMESFNSFYYSFSPGVADLERQSPLFKESVKLAITPLLTTLSILNYVDIDSEAEMIGYGVSLILLNVGMYFVLPAFVIHRVRKFV